MNIIRMEDNDVHNLLQFLNRVEFKGLEELEAMNRILKSISERATEVGKEINTK